MVEKTYTMFTPCKEAKSIFRWLLSARATDDARPLLNCICVEETRVYATNGFLINVWNFAGSKSSKNLWDGINPGLYEVLPFGTRYALEKFVTDFKYPDVDKIISERGSFKISSAGKYQIQIAINANLMRKFSVPISKYSTPVQMLITGGILIFKQTVEEYGELTCAAMPMHIHTEPADGFYIDEDHYSTVAYRKMEELEKVGVA